MILLVLDNIVIAQLKINLRYENYFDSVREMAKLIICYAQVNYRLALSYSCFSFVLEEITCKIAAEDTLC